MHVRRGVGNECRGESYADDLDGGEVFGFRVSAGAAIAIRFFDAASIFVGLVGLAGDGLGNFAEVRGRRDGRADAGRSGGYG